MTQSILFHSSNHILETWERWSKCPVVIRVTPYSSIFTLYPTTWFSLFQQGKQSSYIKTICNGCYHCVTGARPTHPQGCASFYTWYPPMSPLYTGICFHWIPRVGSLMGSGSQLVVNSWSRTLYCATEAWPAQIQFDLHGSFYVTLIHRNMLSLSSTGGFINDLWLPISGEVIK